MRLSALRLGRFGRARTRAGAVLLGAVLALTLAPSIGRAQQLTPPNLNPARSNRSVSGAVLNANSQPISGAVVYLVNQTTKAVRTAVSNPQGRYSFSNLRANTTYTVHAEWQGRKSATRVDSQYNPEQNVRLDLTIPVA